MSTNISRREVLKSVALGVAACGIPQELLNAESADQEKILREFAQPPDDARPWVYWYFMDGHLRREGMEADLVAMKKAGLGGGIFLEVGLGIEPGPVQFMSEPWQELLGHAFSQADNLGLQLALPAGPGWCGAGGPWVKPDQSMQHLVASKTIAQGPAAFDATLPQPPPRTPFFGEETLPPELLKIWREFYRDEFVIAFPTPSAGTSIADIDEKALYLRGSYCSQILGPGITRPWVRPFLGSQARYAATPAAQCIDSGKVVDLTDKLSADGRLVWSVPEGSWTIMRFGRTITGQTTRPAPKPGLGLESDKFDAGAMDEHFDAYIATLLKKAGAPQHAGRGLVALHYDSWEMGSQNWSPHFRDEFKRRRGYDPIALLPTFSGLVVDNLEVSERFLWDIRQTAQELVRQNQVQRLRERGKRYGLMLSLEPYDLNPCADLELGSVADIPSGEFWSKNGAVPSSDFSLVEAASIGHTQGCKVIGAEAFTAPMQDKGHQHPATMKAQGDWAFCQGVNKLVIHRFQAQPWLDRFPGMTMGTDGGYGVNWDRTQTWWDFVRAYHDYLSRCQHMLRRGLPVADILYLTPEGAPSVFCPPRSAFRPGLFAGHREHNFDGCAPETLIARATVTDGRIVFPDGMSYRLLVLPRCQTMTPRLLDKILQLVEAGATIYGTPPSKSPSLSNHPVCDHEVHEIAARLWPEGRNQPVNSVGKGRVFHDVQAATADHANPLGHAKWIWATDDKTDSASGDGIFTFTRDFAIDELGRLQSALVTITADSSYELFLNGHFVLSGFTEQRVKRVDVSSVLRKGANRLSASVKKNRETNGHSGLIASIVFDHGEGNRSTIHTDCVWSCSTAKFEVQRPAAELGAYDMPPWRLHDDSVEQEDIYPSYAETIRILAHMGVRNDFESDASFRYTHRQNGDEHFYFIANGEPVSQHARCIFRVSGHQPEWWDPISGAVRTLPQFSESDERTEIPIHLEPFESGFVVFRKPAAAASPKQGENFPNFATVETLVAPWQVAFDPRWGAPEQVTFSKLEDWTKRPEEGIRAYSGKATYRSTFDCPAFDTKSSYIISLGRVANIASVKINGQEVGVVWCAPWRIAIPKDLLRSRGNALEIVVANLWTNRLIADSGLPPEQRLTWTASNPFQPDDAFIESGLLGPVTIQRVLEN